MTYYPVRQVGLQAQYLTARHQWSSCIYSIDLFQSHCHMEVRDVGLERDKGKDTTERKTSEGLIPNWRSRIRDRPQTQSRIARIAYGTKNYHFYILSVRTHLYATLLKVQSAKWLLCRAHLTKNLSWKPDKKWTQFIYTVGDVIKLPEFNNGNKMNS